LPMRCAHCAKHRGKMLWIDSQEVRRSEDLIGYLARHTTVGQQVTLQVIRDGKTLEIQVTLGERPSTRDRNT